MIDQESDPSQNYLELPPHAVEFFFNPKNIAVIGAKETAGSVGRTLMQNLIHSPFKGEIFPVNPKHQAVMGKICYPNIGSIPKTIDLAVIATPAKTVPDIVEDCGKAGVRAAIVISAGFKELGPEGLALEQKLIAKAKESGIRLIGPNCLGVMNPILGLNATFAASMALPGKIAFISQSGAMCTAVLDWSLQDNIGFSAFISIGSMSDVQWGDIIEYLGRDPHTESILIYMETIGNARSFLSAAREVVLNKPIIVIKAGRSEAAAKAAASHTGSLAGSDEVFDAAMRRVGVLRVNTIGELFNMAEILAKQPRPQGPNLTIVTNAGGPAVLATDAAIQGGAQMTQLTPETIAKLNEILPEAWSHSNPVDLLGDASPERYVKAINILSGDKKTDGILAILSPQDMTDPTATAEALKECSQHLGSKPILASWMGGGAVEKGKELLKGEKIPTFPYPDSAAKTFAKMWQYSRDLKSLYEIPPIRDDVADTISCSLSHFRAREIIDRAVWEDRTLLTENESKAVLAAYGIPVVETYIAKEIDEAQMIAERMGYPVVLKLHSETITHKTDVGGVKLNLRNKQNVAEAFEEIKRSVTQKAGKEHFQGVSVQKMISLDGYEIILGSSVDPQFGPVILFGSGGQLVEVYKDRSLGLPPLNAILARRLMEGTKVYEALKGVRGKKSVDLKTLEQLLIRFSQLVSELPQIKECDINPLLASSDQLIALDARIALFPSTSPLPQLAIRPYPIQYISHATLKNQLPIILRPIRPEDEPLLTTFHKELSEDTVRQRYFEFMSLEKRIAHERLIRMCHTDFAQEITLAAMTIDPQPQILGIARLRRLSNEVGDFKIIIIDRCQHIGLGTLFLTGLIDIAQNEGLKTLHAQILKENIHMIQLCKKFNFKINQSNKNNNIEKATLKF